MTFGDPERALRHVLDEMEAQYRERSGWQPIRCIDPHHSDRNKSASLNLSKGRYRCHACGLAGDGYDLLRQLLGIKAVDFDAGSAAPAVEDTWL